jgi:hypothetical protein
VDIGLGLRHNNSPFFMVKTFWGHLSNFGLTLIVDHVDQV